jgi:predicted DNA-binding protein with PD1-like motif
VRESLEQIAKQYELSAAAIVSCVGSLKHAVLRTGPGELKNYDGQLEIVSLSGTLAVSGMHVHASVATATGETFGGHLVAGSVNTTVEIVIQNLSDEFIFNRVLDKETGYKELSIEKRSKPD